MSFEGEGVIPGIDSAMFDEIYFGRKLFPRKDGMNSFIGCNVINIVYAVIHDEEKYSHFFFNRHTTNTNSVLCNFNRISQKNEIRIVM